ncbi:hypothetical protein glysoja_045426 [Glycine soja]|uniref:Uncharacterized protein n=1 Tax=Glycine soja TaxID=3848 RepID=A0A0B2QVX4_GLYSO|nr:hypothetical protein glysoja_045426 [Glycine soja]
MWYYRPRHCKFDLDCKMEHKDIRRRHTCATTCEECCSLWYDLGNKDIKSS